MKLVVKAPHTGSPEDWDNLAEELHRATGRIIDQGYTIVGVFEGITEDNSFVVSIIEYEPTDVILMGRHTDNVVPGINVIEQDSREFPTDSEQCFLHLLRTLKSAQQRGLAVLIQNVPAILASALIRYKAELTGIVPVGVIILKPGDRRENKTQVFPCTYNYLETLRNVVKFIHPRASVVYEGGLVEIQTAVINSPEFVKVIWL